MKESRWKKQAIATVIGLLITGVVHADASDLFQGFVAIKEVLELANKESAPASSSSESQGSTSDGKGKKAGEQSVVPQNAQEYCAAIKASPLVAEYVKVLAKAAETQAISFDKNVDGYASIRLDNEDGLLQKWVWTTQNRGGPDVQEPYSDFGRRVVDWASLCAAENHDNDLFLFFLTDWYTPAGINAKREEARKALEAFKAAKEVRHITRLDASGNPVVVEVRPRRAVLNFNLSYENDSFAVDSQSIWVTLSAFALANGSNAMKSSGGNAAEKLSELVDHALAAHKQWEAKVLAESKEKERQEATRLAAESKAKAEAKAARNSPNSLLYRSYEAFQIVQACSDARKGYAAVYVSDAELADAKDKIQEIDAKLASKLSGVTADDLWKKAADRNEELFRGLKTAPYQNNRDMCAIMNNELLSLAEKVLGKEVMRKSF